MSRMAGKFSGFRSKKNSGGFPGKNSSQYRKISSTEAALISFPSL